MARPGTDVTRDALQDAAARFTVDLSNCDREPIHIPGAIQPHGALLVLREPDLVVVQASENCEALLGIELTALLGADVEAVLGSDAAATLRSVVAAGTPAAENPLPVSTGTAEARRDWAALAHGGEAGVIVELEPAVEADPRSVAGLFGRVRHGLARLQSTRTLPELFVAMAEEIHRLTGFDRVIVYRFDALWNGEVVAESRARDVESFLGLRFPASDIPAQARELYRRNWLRLIADAAYVPTPVVPALSPVTGAPLDLSGAALRSVSPIHLEYLRNMGVAASMSVSLLRGGKLWGLVACHHQEARYLPYEVRAACEFLGQTFSVQLGTLADEEDRGHAVELGVLHAELLTRAASDDDWAHALVSGTPNLAQLASADGAAVLADGVVYRAGITPDDQEIAGLAHWLTAQGHDVLGTDELSSLVPGAAACAGVASGMLAAAIGRARGDYLFWFRPEVVRTVTWAGNPEKPVEIMAGAAPGGAPAAADAATGGGVARGGDAHAAPLPTLHPRRSFEAWSETVRGRSRPWRAAEVRAAGAIRDDIVAIVLRQADALARLNDELRRSNDELEAFTYIASHDLKEPLRGIRAFASVLHADHGTRLGEEGVAQLETVRRLSRRMDQMLDSLLEFARAGQMELKLVDTDMQVLLDEVLDSLQTRIADAGAEIRIDQRLPVLCCDPVRAAAVLQNLIVNALKYTDKPAPLVEIGWRERRGVVELYVRDDGIGIPAERHEDVFHLFRRLHGRTRYGGGTGAGLTIARRLVERHGGTIRLESTPGETTTFYFTLGPA